MKFSLSESIQILNNTPVVLSALLNNLTDEWITSKEGEGTWSPKEVIAHLIVCEKTDWLPRARIMLSPQPVKELQAIDMTAHFSIAENNSLSVLIHTFNKLRAESIKELQSFNLGEEDFIKSAKHPLLGVVTLQQLISTWVAHDLSHITQVTRVMAKQNTDNVGAFVRFLKLLTPAQQVAVQNV